MTRARPQTAPGGGFLFLGGRTRRLRATQIFGYCEPYRRIGHDASSSFRIGTSSTCGEQQRFRGRSAASRWSAKGSEVVVASVGAAFTATLVGGELCHHTF